MPKAETFDGWLRGVIQKRPAEVVRLLALLCERGLAKGAVSANDIDRHALGVAAPVVGGAFKLVKRLGFVKETITASTKDGRHSSMILSWRLAEGWRAQRFLDECRGLLMRQEAKPVAPAEQMPLL